MKTSEFLLDDVMFKSCFVTTGFGQLHYLDTAQPGDPIVFIHGFPGSHRDWAKFFKNINKSVEHRRKILIDIRGFGKSIPDKPLSKSTPSDLLSDLFQILNHANVKHCSIIGHDLGAMIGWWATMLAPKFFTALISLACPHPAAYAEHYEELERSGQIEYQNELFKSKNEINPEQLIKLLPRDEQRDHLLEALNNSDLETIRGIYRGCLDPKIIRSMPTPTKIRTPVMLVHDNNDPYFLPAMWSNSHKWIEAHFIHVNIEKIGHFIPQNLKKDLSDQIGRFFMKYQVDQSKN